MLGCYRFTRPDVSFTPRQAMNLLMNYNDVNIKELMKNGKKISNFDILIVRNKTQVKKEVLENTTNLKLGLKTGGRIYFRLELGYGMGTLPQTVSFKATDNSNPSYTETTSEDIPEIPGISENGLIIGNIGLGLSF